MKYSLLNQDVDTSFLTLEMTWKGIRSTHVGEEIGVAMPDSFEEIVKGTTINTFVGAEGIPTLVRASARAVLEQEALRAQWITKTKSLTKEIQILASDYRDRVVAISADEVAIFLTRAKELQSEAMTVGTAVACADILGDISNKVTAIFNARPGLRYPTHVYSSLLAGPEEKSLTESAYADIRTSGRNVSDLVREYFWLDQGYVGRGVSAAHIEEIRTHEHASEELPSREEVLAELSLTHEEELVLSVARDLVFVKALRADSRQFIHVVINRLIDSLAEKWGVEARLLETLYAEELIHILRGDAQLPQNLQARWEHSILIPSGEGYEVLVGENKIAMFLRERLSREVVEGAVEVKGQVAYPGSVTGKVRLIFGPQHNGKVGDGDILISTATSPQVLPAMKKAGAFVTDIGGITSHAAIVARELKKPCVVGTKYATQIFKDGDMVEVDAEKGVVRKI